MSKPKLRLLKQTEHWVVIDKPAGFHVHPPEDQNHRIPAYQNCMALLRDQLGHGHVHPIHRIDRATSGAVLFALSHESASILSNKMREHQIQKTYFAMVRGFMKSESGKIDSPLKDDLGIERAATTLWWKVGESLSERMSLLHIEILTGRRHQIRRHMKRESHPLLGDTSYGDKTCNQWVKKHFEKNVLFLKAYQLKFECPWSHNKEVITSQWNSDWHKMFELSGVCGWASRVTT